MSLINAQGHSLKYIDEIQSITKPLQSLNIIHFKFTLFLPEGKRVTFCNDADWLVHFYQRGFHFNRGF